MQFKKLDLRLVYEFVKRNEGKKIVAKQISTETGLGENSVLRALQNLKRTGLIDEEGPQLYFIVPESLT